MNAFEQQISSAKKQHFWGNFVTGVLLLIILGGILAFWLLARATVFTVKPDEISKSYETSLEQGFGLMLGNTFYALSDSFSLKFSMAEFQEKTVSVEKNDPQIQVVTLQPLPALVQITTRPALKETQWRVDGLQNQVGKTFIQNFEPGDYQLDIDNPYYQIKTVNLTLRRAEQVDQVIELQPVSGSMTLNSVPDGGEVTIDGQIVGKTPLMLTQVGGRYRVEVRALGYETIRDEIAITHAQPSPQRRYQLAPATMLVNFDLTPNEGILYVNGNIVQNGSARLAVNHKHNIRYSKPGFQNYAATLEIPLANYDDSGSTLDHPIVLSPLYGKLDISTNIAAQIYVNDELKGLSPLSLSLPSKSAKIAVKAEGYRTQYHEITPEPNITSNLHFELKTEFMARRAEGKPSVAKNLGIDLIAFKPDKIEMGSLPNEPYRRRNEFRREVKFSKPILVSRYEITEGQFNRINQGRNGSKLPVVNVSWEQAALFCNELSKREGLPPFYRESGGNIVGFNADSIGYRLPSEAEWEWLAGKAKKAKKTMFPWGDDSLPGKNEENLADKTLKAQQVFYFKEYDDGMAGRASVGSFKEGRNGLYDLGGNVSEWVHDAYTNRPPQENEVVTDFMGPTTASKDGGHVVKGGNFKSGQLTEIRVAYREPMSGKSDNTGFRIVRTLSPEERF